MYQGFNDEISPWQNDPRNIFTIQYDEPKITIMKKLSTEIDQRRSVIKHKRRNNFKGDLLKQHHKNYSLKNNLPHYISAQSQQQISLYRPEKLKHELKRSKNFIGNKSSMFELQRKKSIDPPAMSDFTIRKYDRVKRFSRALFKDIKMDDIFKKLHEIQNPTQRQNISLPKIQIKI